MSKMTDNVPEFGDEVEVTNSNSRYWRLKGSVVHTTPSKVTVKTQNSRIATVSKLSVTVTKKASLPKDPAPQLAKKAPELNMFVFVFTDEQKLISREQVLNEMLQLSFDDMMVVVKPSFEDAVDYIRTEIEEQLDQDCCVYCCMPDKSFIQIKVGKFEYEKLV